METRNASEELESWITIINPETEAFILQKKLDTVQSEKKLLKQEVEQYLKETVNTLKSVDFAKLNYEKLEMDLKKSNDALEKQSHTAMEEKTRLLAQNIKLQNQMNKLKKIIKNNKTTRKQTTKLIVRLVEKLTVQHNSEMIQLKKENEAQKSLIEKIRTKNAGFFSPKETPAGSDSFTHRQLSQ